MYIVNVDWFFISHRLQVAKAAHKSGFQIHVVTSITNHYKKMKSEGFVVHPINFKRGKTGLFSYLKDFFNILSIIQREKPDIVHTVTIKAVLLGGIAARLARVRGIVAAISGLGYVFTARGLIAHIRRFFVACLYKFALGDKNTKLIFQNLDDMYLINSIVSFKRNNVDLIKGSGVDLKKFNVRQNMENKLNVVLPARMLKDKGVIEFVDAARMLTKSGVKEKTNANFVLVGDPDLDNPTSLSLEQIQSWVQAGYVEHWGFCENMSNVYTRSAIIVLPSYREGFPKVLIEAAACGKPIVTTDVPGCRDAILEEKTGLLVPAKNSDLLAKAIEILLKSKKMRDKMGKRARKFAEISFNIDSVAERHIQIYQKLIEKNNKTCCN